MRFRRKTIGTKNFGPMIDITDPCYNKDIWCRKNNIEIIPGEYTCVTWTHTSNYEMNGKTHKDKRVGIIGIYLSGIIPTEKSMEEIGSIGVDAGLAGFFENKPDYTDDEWDNFCSKIRKGNAWIFDEGFFSESGYGDGCYPVFAHKDQNSGKYTSVEIRFM